MGFAGEEQKLLDLLTGSILNLQFIDHILLMEIIHWRRKDYDLNVVQPALRTTNKRS